MKHALIALAAVIVVGCTKNVHLQDYSPTDAGFTASMPAAPREESRDLKTALGTLTEHSFIADYDEVTYSVTYVPIPGEVAREFQKRPELIDAVRQTMIQRFQGQSLGHREVKSGSYPSVDGQEFTIALPGGTRNLTVRIFFTQDTLFQVQIIAPRNPSHRQDIYPKQFLDSFRLTAS